jgi:hypothetical protein
MPIQEFFQRVMGGRGQPSIGERYVRVLNRLAEDAMQWTLVAVGGLRCSVELRVRGQVVACADHAAGTCLACGLPCCLAHAMIAPKKMLCMSCVAGAVERVRAGGRPGPAEATPFGYADPGHDAGAHADADAVAAAELERIRREHLRVLGLRAGATAAEIKKAYHALARRHHPDRQRGRVAQDRASDQMKRINVAYDWLERHPETEAA